MQLRVRGREDEHLDRVRDRRPDLARSLDVDVEEHIEPVIDEFRKPPARSSVEISVHLRPFDEFSGRRQIDFVEVGDRNFVGLTNATALAIHIGKHAARLGMRLHFRARLRDFDAICQLVAADVGVALVPRDMGLPIREPVPAAVSAPAKVK